MRTRIMIVIHSADGKSQIDIAHALGCSASTVYRVRRRWRQSGRDGLADRRENNGQTKADDLYADTLLWVLRGTPQDHGHRRPTWTQTLLIETLASYTGVRISVSTMSRLLSRLGVRRGMPKPTVGCPWTKAAKERRIAMIRKLIASLPADEVAVWEDEVDIDLNPKIGPDWMLPGTQRRVVTPGQNRKAYLAGAMDATTDRLIWVKGDRKNSDLFIALLAKLLKVYRGRKRIHVILDNYVIHNSRRTRAWLAEHGQRICLHFLPPYCPDDNRIERSVWRELHANVTRNHTCVELDELVGEAEDYLHGQNRAANKKARSQSRKAI
ncbi:MAG: IS630 family transposase [Phycisphaerae bacterium]